MLEIMPKKMTKEEFVEKANRKHGIGRFCYDESVYNGSMKQMMIKCNVCGTTFPQTPNAHLSGRGCPTCGRMAAKEKTTLTKDEFLKRANDVWGDLCDYSESIYINSYTPIIVKCNIHNKTFKVRPSAHITQKVGCKLCAIDRRRIALSHPHKSIEEIKEELKEKCGELYELIDFNEYTGVNQVVKVFCKRCGNIFEKTISSLLGGHGCNTCTRKSLQERFIGKSNVKAKRLVYGVGINDIQDCAIGNTCYEIWHGILQRTVNEKYKSSHKAYKDASICDEWLLLSNFKAWYDEHYIEGWCIDKDLLGLNTKKYSPETCCFVPIEINSALTREKFSRGLPIGVMKKKGKFIAVCRHKFLGTFNTVKDAEKAYLKEKKKRIIELANKWKDKIEPRAYNALINLDIKKFFNNK